MRELLALTLIVAAAVLAPVISFLAFGPQLETRMEAWCDTALPAPMASALIVALLSTDVFLPVPSSFVSTFGGARLGAVGGTIVSWTGMTLGAVIGFVAARVGGRPLAVRLAGEAEVRRIDQLATRFGLQLVIFTRAVPILAEATVLLLGATRLAWGTFLLTVGFSNLGIAAVYSIFGSVASQHDALVPALVASIALPLAAIWIFRRWLPAVDEVRPAEQQI